MSIFSKEFVLGAAERALKTAAQTLIAAMSVNQVGIMDFDWAGALSVTAFAAILSVLTSIVSPSFTAGTQVPVVVAAPSDTAAPESDAEEIAPEDVTAAIADAEAITLTGVAGSDALASDAALTPEAAAAASADAAVTAPYRAKHVADAPAASAPTATGAAKTKTDGQLEITQDGILGGATIARWQHVMGTPIDGEISRGGSPVVVAFQKFLNSVVAGEHQKNLHGAATLATDGILGPATWKTYQFWSGNKLPGDMKNICGFTLTGSTIGKWVDGVAGKWTITMLQVMLNRSYAGSGKLFSK